MRPVKRAGWAAGIITVAGAQAADLPVKARRVDDARAPRPCVTSKKSK